MADQMGGRRRYETNNAPAVPTITVGSADEMASTVDEAIGVATFVVFSAASATVCNKGNGSFTNLGSEIRIFKAMFKINPKIF